jgi:phosphoribosylanthranilate isomerase
MPIYPGTNAPLTLDVLDRMMQENIGAYFITQHNKSNADVYKQIVALNHEVLFDASGGRGILGDWHSPIPGKICGYAGGLGPDNVLQELEKISAICNKPFWIDMEGKLRTDDKFDLTKCVAVLDQIDSKYGSPL